MTIYESLMKTIQDDARRAGERNRLLLEVQQARRASRQRPVPAEAGDTFFAVSYRAILVRLDCRAWLSVRRPERRFRSFSAVIAMHDGAWFRRREFRTRRSRGRVRR
jgi:hypothetical protein